MLSCPVDLLAFGQDAMRDGWRIEEVENKKLKGYKTTGKQKVKKVASHILCLYPYPYLSESMTRTDQN